MRKEAGAARMSAKGVRVHAGMMEEWAEVRAEAWAG